ncbi:MAG: multidrug resistance efflux transporter family protein, partial [Chloroflexota bacterium]
LCKQPYEIAAVDATQSMEVVFSLLGEILFLGGAIPGALGLAGVALTILGLAAYMRTQVE